MRSLVAAAVLALAGAAAAAPGDIQPAALLEHIKFLSSDELQGRGDGSPELERAAEYVAAQFRGAGLRPGGEGGTWFQGFELVAGLTIGERNELSFGFGGRTARFTLGTSYYPLAAPSSDSDTSPSATLEGLPLVFAGYGLVVPSIGYDDYRRVDVDGKAVVIFSHEPQERLSGSPMNGARPVMESTLAAKEGAARSRGAKALIVIGDPTHLIDQADYTLFSKDPDAEERPIPVLRVRRREVQPLVDHYQLDSLARLIDADLVPRSMALNGATITYVEHLTKNRRTVRNVVGVLPGSDPRLEKEAVVVGAHYDHVGRGGHLSMSPERTGEVHNGADDNASGTSAVIEIARHAAAHRERFPRTLVFVAFAGEERGLLGSAHYVEAPAVPAADTIAMLNLDMVGRARGNVDVSGLEYAPSIEEDLKGAAQGRRGLSIKREGPGAGRSDDSSFQARRIPAINFFTGFHGDYHRPGDDWEKIDAEGTSQIAMLAFELAARLAARPARPEFVQR
ncbi:MAG TPA: M20/M25/M40 family metallo-hydrolase [Vicinamibacterales bacterium]|nr:M20/M25/M40 family metallo-hydrolase [Vicinamibacterales bacterium]